jgi:hypothetical protein
LLKQPDKQETSSKADVVANEASFRLIPTTALTRRFEAKLRYQPRSAEDGRLIGVDGSQMNGRSEVASAVGEIFANHRAPAS